jgi:hypothetical protein
MTTIQDINIDINNTTAKEALNELQTVLDNVFIKLDNNIDIQYPHECYALKDNEEVVFIVPLLKNIIDLENFNKRINGTGRYAGNDGWEDSGFVDDFFKMGGAYCGQRISMEVLNNPKLLQQKYNEMFSIEKKNIDDFSLIRTLYTVRNFLQRVSGSRHSF